MNKYKDEIKIYAPDELLPSERAFTQLGRIIRDERINRPVVGLIDIHDKEGNDFIEQAFQPGTSEIFVTQGTLLGYTGIYNGSSLRDIWVHLHFSIVKDDGNGRYTNELEFENTLDPSPYLGMGVNYACTEAAIGCTENPTCS